MTSAASIGRIPKRAEQQRNVIVAFRVDDLKYDIGVWIKPRHFLLGKIVAGMKTHTIVSGTQHMINRKQIRHTTIVVGNARGQYDPAVLRLLDIETYRNS